MSADLIALKLQIARSQLSVALDLFVRDQDPIAVHCLACGGAEVIDGVTELLGKSPFREHAMLSTGIDKSDFVRLRNIYWNAFKHVMSRESKPRIDDVDLVNSFRDEVNDSALFCGWYDYMVVSRTLPIAAQVFQTWYFACNPGKLAPDTDQAVYSSHFPDLARNTRAEQKQALRLTIARHETSPQLLEDPMTEPKLLLSPQ